MGGAAKEVLDFVAWPLKQFIWFLKFGLWIVAVFCVLFFWSFHWIFAGNQMHKAQLARYASVQHEYTVDFREVAGSYPFRFENAKGQAWKPVEFCPIEQERTIEDSAQRYDDQMVREANNETEITFKNIDVTWISRKSGKLYRNYAMAAATVTTMRNYLAQLKFGTGKYHSIACVPEANDEKIVLRDAPIIQLTRVRDQEGSLYQGKTIILGVWIKGQGTPADKILESDSHIADVHDPVLLRTGKRRLTQ